MTDVSRLGRDYLQVGFYTEVMFRQKDVRFIAISNNIDSDNGESSEFAPFLNIMSEWYARDCSRKLKAVYQSKGHNGKRTNNNCIYGYLKAPDDKNKWFVDPEAAEVIRRIYALSVEGKGPHTIARMLEMEKIETPGCHQARLGVGNRKNFVYKNPYHWAGSTVAAIIEKPEYLGHTVNFRSSKKSYKDKSQKPNPKDMWVIHENTHDAIVEQGVWQAAQRSRTVKRRTDLNGASHPLTGILFCSDCGRRLYCHSRGGKPMVNPRNGNIINPSLRYDYICKTYQSYGTCTRDKCTMHFISEKTANNLILEAIRQTTSYARNNETEFIQMLREESALKQADTAKSHKRQISKNEKRILLLDSLFRKTYEDFSAGLLTESRFKQLSQDYENEQIELQQQTETIRAELEQFDNDNIKVDKFMELVRKYTDFSELTPAMLTEFIDKVIVFNPEKINGVREQRVDIYLNYVGMFEVPPNYEDELHSIENLQDNPQEIKRAKWRESARKQREKERLAKAIQIQNETSA